MGSFLTSNVHVCQTSYLLNPYVAILWLHCSKPALVHLNNQLVITIKSQFNKKIIEHFGCYMVFTTLIHWRYSQVAILWLPPCRSCKFVATAKTFLIVDVSNAILNQLIGTQHIGTKFPHPSCKNQLFV